MMRIHRRININWVTEDFMWSVQFISERMGFYCIMGRQPLTFR